MSKNNYAMKSQKDSENYGKDMNKEADNDLQIGRASCRERV